MRLPDLSVGKKYLERVAAGVLTRIESRTGMRRNQILVAALLLALMLTSLLLFFSLKNRPHDPGGFGVPDDFGVLAAETVVHPQSPLAPAVGAWRRGSPWVALDLLRQAQTNHLTTEEHLAALNYAGHIRIWIGDLAAAGAAFQAGAGLKKNAGSAYGLGRVAELKNDYPLAVRQYRTAVEYRPDFALAWRRMGDVLMRQKDFEQAVLAYTRSLEISSLDITRYRLGEALVSQGQGEAARQHFQYILEHAHHSLLVGYAAARLGDLEDVRGDLKRAAELYQQAVRVCPETAAFRHNLGGILVRAGRLEEAMSVYLALRGAILKKKNPTISDTELRQSLARVIGETWYDRNDTAAALRFLSEAGREDSEVLAMLGDLFFLRGEYDDALGYYARVVANLPGQRLGLVALVNTGTIWLERMKPERALHAWEKALQIEPENPRVLCNIGLAHLALRDNKAAETAFRKAWTLDQSLTNALALLAATMPVGEIITLLREGEDKASGWFALHTLGRLYHRKREYGSAIEVLERAIKAAARPSEADASRLLLARCRMARDEHDLAARELQPIGERYAQDPLWLYQMGLLSWKTGSLTNARRYFSSAEQAQASPRLAAAIRYWLGNMEWKEGHIAGALAGYRAALTLHPGHTAAAVNAAWCVNRLAEGRKQGKRSRLDEGTLR
ncbi:MAG TPA: tetratricopeptide repeat protein [Spirochaetota bacterium]|nr:tetratricopeptide repeat protein [Spirochaetota bacterium]HPN82513.1 tetratricopeptide repeat protein [Spirochaetota bacterium]